MTNPAKPISPALWLTFLLASLGTIQFLKGWTTHTNTYNLTKYIFTYEDGFIRRGVVSSLIKALTPQTGDALANLPALALFLSQTSAVLCLCAALIYVYRHHHHRSINRTDLAFFCSPFLSLLATCGGGLDGWVALTTIFTAFALRIGFFIPAALGICLGTMIHESALLLSLPLFLAALSLHPDKKRKLWLIFSILTLVGLTYLIGTTLHAGDLKPIVENRCAGGRVMISHFIRLWDESCNTITQPAEQQGLGKALITVSQIPIYAVLYGWFSLWAFLQCHNTLQRLIILFPSGLLIGWDTDRLFVLMGLSNWLALGMFQNMEAAATLTLKMKTLWVICLAQFFVEYPFIPVYSQQTDHMLSGTVFWNPQSALSHGLTLMELPIPGKLRSDYLTYWDTPPP